MRIVVAPDRYGRLLSSSEVTAAIARSTLAIFPEAEVVALPMADGSLGTADAIAFAAQAAKIRCPAVDPAGRGLEADIALLQSGVIIIDAESVCASALISPDELAGASTRGLGMLIKAALDIGMSTVIIAAGGELACADGGQGALKELGFPDNPLPGIESTSYIILTDAKGENDFTRNLARSLRAERKDGTSIVFDILNFDQKIKDTALLITGEYYSGDGSIAAEAARRASNTEIPVLSVCADFGERDVYDLGVSKLALCADYASGKADMDSRLQPLVEQAALYALREIETGLSHIILPEDPYKE